MVEFHEISLSGMRFYTTWHLNLNYSSVEVRDHFKIIDECYWPILDLAQRAGIPFGLEINASSLARIDKIDPSWIGQALTLEREGLIEFIASGYIQIIGPLAPHHINLENYLRGQEILQDILGLRPRIAFANEQCISRGTLETFREAGFEAVVIEWENTWLANPDLPEHTGYRPQRAHEAQGLGIIWNHSRLFQGLQRVAHRELTIESYLELLRKRHLGSDVALCFYGGDAETFDFRPGRFKSESRMWGSEWGIVSEVISRISNSGGKFVLPSDLLGELPLHGLELFSGGNQIITKKQAKYNATRWAVGGRDNYELNNYAAFRELSQGKSPRFPQESDFDRRLELWSSDVRTHLTERRWKRLISQHPQIRGFSSRHQTDLSGPKSAAAVVSEPKPHTLATNSIAVDLDFGRGLTVDSLTPNCDCGVKLIGRLPFGSIKGPHHSPDWYTGNITFQEPGLAQETELSSGFASRYWRSGNSQVFSEHSHHAFELLKRFQVGADSDSVEFEYRFNWNARPRGITRAGFLTFLPDGWDWENFNFSASNGASKRASYPIGKERIRHGAPISPLVSASNCVGLTDGGFSVTDGRHQLEISLMHYSRGAIALLDFDPDVSPKFLHISFSLQEIDDTSQHRAPGSTAFGFSLSAKCLVG